MKTFATTIARITKPSMAVMALLTPLLLDLKDLIFVNYFHRTLQYANQTAMYSEKNCEAKLHIHNVSATCTQNIQMQTSARFVETDQRKSVLVTRSS